MDELALHFGHLGAQVGQLLVDLGALALRCGGDFLSALLGVSRNLPGVLFGIVGELTHPLLGVLHKGVNLTLALVQELEAFLEQARRLRRGPALVTR